MSGSDPALGSPPTARRELGETDIVPVAADHERALPPDEGMLPAGLDEDLIDGGEPKDTREDIKELERRSMEQDIELRKSFATRIFFFVVAWVAALIGLTLLQGFDSGGFELTDGVLMTLIGGTTANVLGLFAIVANYLFPKR